MGMTMDDLGNLFEVIAMLLAGVVLAPIVVATMAAVALLIGRVVRRVLTGKVRRGYLRQIRTIVTEYEAPFDLRPAEIAYLYDTTVGKEEVLATVFDLERRGYVTVTALDTNDDFFIHHTDNHDYTKLHEVDSHVLAMIGSKGCRWGALQKEATKLFAEGSFGRVIERSLIELGFLRSHTTKRQHSHILARTVISVAVAIGACMLVYKGAPMVVGALVMQLAWVPFLYQDLVGYMHKSARVSREATPLLAKVWPQIEGFCEFVKVVELDRIAHANRNKQQEYRHAVLPYAIALNLPVNWKDRFK